MSAGVPVVATNVGGNPEVIRHGSSGLLCPARDPASLADRLLELLGDPARARQLADRARESVLASYSQDRMVADYTELYEALLAEKGIP
jgi:glycosyltransferase involved in cell wall biosynthesis